MRGAWVEINLYELPTFWVESLPVRGAWVEMRTRKSSVIFDIVAPRAGSVG